MAVLGVAFGFLLRSATGALAALLGLLFLLPLVGMLLPQVEPYLPSAAASGVLQTGPTGDGLSPLAGLGVLALHAAVALTAAAVTFARRDA